MRARLGTATLLLAGALSLVGGAAHAIVQGTPDGTAHPAVGGLVADTAYRRNLDLLLRLAGRADRLPDRRPLRRGR